MYFLLRLATKTAWHGGEPNRQRAMGDFALREGERGISVWAYDSEEERGLVLSAIACRRLADGSHLDKVDFLAIPVELVEKFGAITKTQGDTPISDANEGLHHELMWSADALEALAGTLFEAGYSAVRVPKPEIRKLLCGLPPEAIDEVVRPLVEQERSRLKAKK